MVPEYLSLEALDRFVALALAEDVGSGDVTTEATVPAHVVASGRFLAKADGILAGALAAERVFAAVDTRIRIDWLAADGDPLRAGGVFGTVRGPARGLLLGERLALNLLQRMSGIATLTRRMTEAVGPHRARILDTRKTAPGLRLLDKWAVRLGGGTNHRIGLYDRILIKDNHIAAAGGIYAALSAAAAFRKTTRRDVAIEIEARMLDEVRQVLDAGIGEIILLDNMVLRTETGDVDTTMLRDAVRLVAGRLVTEASGNATLDTIPAIAATGVDYISSGALTHSVQALDLSLKLEID
jgi:nicotinate-nucleotide pyrophosphorylase (carboxylating)